MELSESIKRLLPVEIAIIGGSGLADFKDVKVLREIKPEEMETPFGRPSHITICEINGKKVAFLCRHDKGHRFSPTHVPYAANAYALRILGVKIVIGISACGTLSELIKPGELVVPHQLVNGTIRPHSFFTIAVHVPMGKPFCEELRSEIIKTLQVEFPEFKVHHNAVYYTMEGPQYSTDAEHQDYISRGFHIIGMTTYTEACYLREAGICYAVIAMPTDSYYRYLPHDDVDSKLVEKVFGENIGKVLLILPKIIERVDAENDCRNRHLLLNNIHTNYRAVPSEEFQLLKVLMGEYDLLTWMG